MRFVKKAMIRIVLCLSIVILLVAFCFRDVLEASEQDVVSGNYYVIMFDISGSMNNADPRLKGIVADFLLQIPLVQHPYKIAIIPFASKCPETDMLKNGNDDWWEIQTENGQTGERLKHALELLEYTGAHTDIEEALRKCAQTLKDLKSNGSVCNPTVLFITDGVIDLPGDRSNSDRSSIDKIIKSAENILGIDEDGIAEEFPDDCKFWAIVPDDISESAIVTYDNGNIISYYGKAVEADQQDGIRTVLSCLEVFCSQLNMLQPEGRADRAGIIKMDWTANTLQNFKKAYKDFLEQTFGTTMTTKEEVDLGAGFDFFVPDGTAEVNLTVTPEIDDIDRCKEIAAWLLEEGMISITMDEFQPEIVIGDSIYAINIKLKNPPTGTYHLQTAVNGQYSFTLDFLTYNNLKITMSEQNITKVLGTTVLLEGNIVDSKGTAITEQTAHNLLLEVVQVDEFGEEIEGSIVEMETDKFQCNFTASRIGSNYFMFYINYDDTNDPQILGGISKFKHQEMITIEVPEVSYTGNMTQHIFSEADYKLQPYSVISGEQINVAAEATKKYLDDDWVLRLFDGQGVQINKDTPFQISENGEYFILKYENRNVKSAVAYNRTTDQSVELEVLPIPINAIIFAVTSVFLVLLVIIIIIVILLSQMKIKSTIRWNGESKVLYLRRDGTPEPGELAGRPLTAYYSKIDKQVVAHLNGRTKRADVVSHRCDIDF